MSISHNSIHAADGELERLQREVADLIVTTLNLEVTASELTADQPLFGDKGGLGLDSIDALEIALVIEHRYGAKISSEDEDNDKRFASIRSLAAFIREARTPKPALAEQAGD
jgi:acyl carrier protein